MPERSFGRTVRYRRTKLGLSQAQLGELVGRSTASIRSWERDKNRPNDPKVISTLSAILGVDERHMFEKADVALPEPSDRADPTVEQALAELGPVEDPPVDPAMEPVTVDLESHETEWVVDVEETLSETGADPDGTDGAAEQGPESDEETLVATPSPSPGFVAPPDRYVTSSPAPTLSDLSYMEDNSQRQLYRVRTLATLVGLVALVVAFLWAVGEGLGALGDWWDEFFGNLRL